MCPPGFTEAQCPRCWPFPFSSSPLSSSQNRFIRFWGCFLTAGVEQCNSYCNTRQSHTHYDTLPAIGKILTKQMTQTLTSLVQALATVSGQGSCSSIGARGRRGSAVFPNQWRSEGRSKAAFASTGCLR